MTCSGTAQVINLSGTSGSAVYYYGLVFSSANTGAGTVALTSTATALELDSCQFILTGASGTAKIGAGNGSYWKSCSVKFAATGQGISGTGGWIWTGGSILSGGVSPTALFPVGAIGFVENVDFSNASSSMNFSADINGARQLVLRNCVLPVGWSGALSSVTQGPNGVVVLNNCDSSGTNYILHRQTQFGDVYSETTIVRLGGASDGSTPLSWKMVSLAASGTFPITALQTGEFVIWNDTVGSSRTVTVEFIHDSLTALNNNEIWLELNYYGSSGNPQGTLITDAMADVLATPAAQPSSSATWTTTGITNPNKQKLQVTFTPQLKGFFLATVKLCKASYTVYVDPMMTVT